MDLLLYQWENELFGDALMRYLDFTKPSLQQTTYDSYKKYSEKISDWFNTRNILVKDISPEIIEEYYDYLRLTSRISENTVRHYHVIIYKFCKWLYKRSYLKENPADKIISKPKAKKYYAKFYTAEEAKKLLSVVSEQYPKYFIAILLAVSYGLRRSEICALQWQDIDFKNEMLHVRKKLVKVYENGKAVLLLSDQLKSESCRRNLPLSSSTLEVLNNLHTQKTEKTDFVFSLKNGEAVNPDTLTTVFKRMLRKNELPEIRFHDLRHSCASILINNDVPLKFIQEWLGHSTYNITANIYAHVQESSKKLCTTTMENCLF